ncbi:MAG: carboxylating nicotinate-nucleotide diphosphorylase [Chlorobi bacterium]|nr:MAG: nicotinate-nucleotide pyrophosphorylase [Chlorobi bacterium OLB7]MBK8912425.1 carboxylating nicotinate-nucleotide diphosphorylase [Chlorobiota bacterium]MBX7218100.1 carboxylating nicotinate-nucleotide diphosphorylase [Candidatus Kapabacteria bacterium]
MPYPALLNDLSILRLVQIALNEDIGDGDVTSESLLPPETYGQAVMLAKAEGVVAGTAIADLAFREVDGDVTCDWMMEDGARVAPGSVIGHIRGPVRSIIIGERTALNFMQRMSGVATLTRRFVDAIAGTGATILDTRKTIPGWRLLDKYAVAAGGGKNHRMGLYDMVMIKDNHIEAYGSITGAVQAASAWLGERGLQERIPIEVETRNLDEVREALKLPAVARIMFDNFTLEMMRQGAALVDGAKETEASGDVTLENVRQVAETGVQFISSGALTHSAKALNISLEIMRQ